MTDLGLNDSDEQFFFTQEEIIPAIALTGWPEFTRSDPARALSNAAVALKRWIALGLPIRHTALGPRFSSGHVINFVRAAWADGRDDVYATGTIPQGRELTARAMTVPPPLGGPALHTPRRFRVTIRRVFHAGAYPQGRPLRLRLPLPYDDRAQQDLDMSFRLPSGDSVKVERFPGRLDVLLPARDNDEDIALEAEMTVTAYQQHGAVSGEQDLTSGERDLYLRTKENLIRVTPAIRQLAAELCGSETDPVQKLDAFWRFFFPRMKLGVLNHDELDRADPLTDILRRGWSDCLGGSAVLVALCRASAIPARLIHGIMMHDAAACFHYWAEVHIAGKGWLPADLAAWELAAGDADCVPWGRLFLGNLEYRLKCGCLPHIAVGPVGIRMPEHLCWTLTPREGGTRMTFYDIQARRPLYSDDVRVTPI